MGIWGYCYLLWYQDLNVYKIGFGKSAKKRHRQLQQTYPSKLVMIGSCYCFNPRKLESQLHKRYGTKRLRRGEFFSLNDEDVCDVVATFKAKTGLVIV